MGMFDKRLETTPAKPKPSGMEMMFRSMGLGEALDATKALVEGGALEKILAFADAVEKMQASLDRIEKRLLVLEERENAAISHANPQPRTNPDIIAGRRHYVSTIGEPSSD